MVRTWNPIRLLLLGIGALFVRFGLISNERARETTDLAWPRILTGLARMSRSVVDTGRRPGALTDSETGAQGNTLQAKKNGVDG